MSNERKSRWERCIEARMIVLDTNGAALSEAAGWTRAQLSRIKKQTDPKLSQVRRMALLLGIEDAAVLIGEPANILSVPVPDWDWLIAVAKHRDEAGFAEYIGESDVWSLAQLRRAYYAA